MWRAKGLFIFLCGTLLGSLSLSGQDSPDWTDSVDVDDTAIWTVSESIGNFSFYSMRWIKFTWLAGNDGGRLYFQNSRKYPFHYSFGVEHIPEFDGFSTTAYDQATLVNDSRIAYVGAVLLIEYWQNDYQPKAAAIQVSGTEVIDRNDLASVYQRVREALTVPESLPVVYIPTFEQAAYAHDNATWLAEEGIEVSSLLKWTGTSATYNSGWAIGKLVRVPADDIEQAYRAGVLRPEDILLTDAVPAEVPFVAGIISEYPATPNSHVAILAGSWDVPFIYINPETMDFTELIGQVVVMRNSSVSLLDPEIDPALLDKIMALKTTPELEIPSMQLDIGSLSLPIEDLGPGDIDKVGGKAANYGLLRDAIPDQSRQAIAFTFDLWNVFMDQHMPAYGHSLRQEIADRLAPFTSYPPDFDVIETVLDGIEDMIRDEADFSMEQKASILAALSPFDADQKIRFRSSTNVEDGDFFTGAGLYDSYSGCLLDDTDTNEFGPSHCDAEEASERGVFRAMRRVYGSFYNTNAFLERLRYGVDESKVGMGILVHHSFPDETELANGVAIYDPNPRGYPRVTIVTQKGAVSVTNPDGDAIPEVVEATNYPAGFGSFFMRDSSNLLILGESSVMEWEADYRDLGTYMITVAEAWAETRPNLADRRLEFEFKKLAPLGNVVIKQVRPLLPEAEATETRFLLAGSVELDVYQGESSDALALHRAKSRWKLEVSSMEISEDDPQSLYSSVEYTFADETGIATWTGGPVDWPEATFSTDLSYNERLVYQNSWNQSVAGIEARRTLEAEWPAASPIPLYFPSDLEFQLVTEFPEKPHPYAGDNWSPWILDLDDDELSVIEYARLNKFSHVTEEPGAGDILVERSLSRLGETANITFYWPPHPGGFTAGYTAPLSAWKETRLEGMASSPIVLTDYFSQTYRPGHHNFSERFVFEPRLDPGVPQALKDELKQLGIRFIGVTFASPGNVIYTAGVDEDFHDPLEDWFGDLTQIAWYDLYTSPWLGDFQADEFPYVRHQTLGWFYVDGTGPENFWMYFLNPLGWVWTHHDLFPYCYSIGERHWLYYLKGSSAPSWWYHYATEEWAPAD